MAKSFLYNQIKQDIIHKIDADIYKNGDKLPSEAQLVEEYGVSRNTASRVLNDLVEEGYARRRQGKGTFVYNQKIDNRLQGIQSFTDMFERNNKNPSTKVLAYEVVDEPPARVRENLHLGGGRRPSASTGCAMPTTPPLSSTRPFAASAGLRDRWSATPPPSFPTAI